MGSYLGDSVLLYLEELKAQADKVLGGMNQILAASSALLADFRYALMSAQSLAEVVASVIAGAELLKQAKADPRRFDLATSWISRRMNDLEGRCKRIREGSTGRRRSLRSTIERDGVH